MFPVILDPKILDPPFEVGVHICPILASNGDHLVFVGKGKVPQVRLQPAGLAMRELTEGNCGPQSRPTFDPETELLDFQSQQMSAFLPRTDA
jgi:hypothetical protein